MKVSEMVAELERVRDHLSEDLRVRDGSIDWLEGEVERLKSEGAALREAVGAMAAKASDQDNQFYERWRKAEAERDAARAEVERLKAQEQATSELCRERSAEVERLKPAAETWAAVAGAHVAKADELHAEVERLRAAPIIIDPEEREKLRKLGRIP